MNKNAFHGDKIFIGEEFDPCTRMSTNPLFMDISNISTHGVIIGMTGSGKTGLGIAVMEEALINEVPVIAIDVKGDLSNLGLGVFDSSYDALTPAQTEEHRRKLVDMDFAEKVNTFRKNVMINIYTPGYINGRPVSLINSLRPPSKSVGSDELRDIASNVAASFLSLIGVEHQPFKGKEHTLLSEVLKYSWENHIDLDFGSLMRLVLDPPFDRVGGIDLESFMPLKQRRSFAFMMNSVFTSPDFRKWIHGDPLDIDHFLKLEKTVASLFYLAHLDSDEKMLFVSLLLQKIYSWVLTKGASERPRLLVFFDEVFGFLPPFPRNPVSKPPLLSLIKQGRSFGVTVFLSTQNPIDIDYKALGNVYLWIIGRLQTRNDRRRVLEGVAEAGLSGSTQMGEHDIEALISTLGQREFLMYDVKENSLRFFRSRECISCLIGPLTPERAALIARGGEVKQHLKTLEIPEQLLELPPAVCEKLRQQYLPVRYSIGDVKKHLQSRDLVLAGGEYILYYEPLLLLEGEVRIQANHPRIQKVSKVSRIIPISSSFKELKFLERTEPGLTAEELRQYPLETHMSLEFRFKPVNHLVIDLTGYKRLTNLFLKHIVESSRIVIFRCEQTGDYSMEGEERVEFEKRQREILVERSKEQLRKRYEAAISKLSRRVISETEKLEKLKSSFEEAKTSLILKGFSKLLTTRKLRSVPGKIHSEIKRLRRLESIVKSKEFELAGLLNEKREKEIELSLRLGKLDMEIKPKILEVSITPCLKDAKVVDELLIWVPIAELDVLLDDRKSRVKVNCFNLAYI
ncbi:MAG: helicase HerA-like domain-containing protein [Thermoproteota archaeon]